MWDWKQVKWMKLLGWDVFEETKGKFRMLTRLQASIMFWIIPISIFGETVAILKSVRMGDYKVAITSVSILGTSIPMIFKSFKWAHRGAEIKAIIEEFEDLDQRRKKYFRHDNHSVSIMEIHTRNCNKYCYLFIGSLLAGSHWPVRSLVLAIHGEYTTIVNDWVPWDNKTFEGWLFHSIWISFALVVSVSAMLAYETLMLSFHELIIGLFESISYGLSNLRFETKNQRLRELYALHRETLILTKKVNEFSRFIIQADSLLLTFTMCCGVLEITGSIQSNLVRSMVLQQRDWSTTTKKINTIEMFLVYALFFYLQCYKSHMVTLASSDLALDAYNNDWYLGTNRDKQNLFIIVQMTRRPVKFGGIIRIDLSTFIAVMKTSFSYYNVLKAFDI